MGAAHDPEPVKLVASLLTENLNCSPGQGGLVEGTGPIDLESDYCPSITPAITRPSLDQACNDRS